TFIDNTVKPSTQYFYRIYAVNAAGNSKYSNLDSATTKAVDKAPPVITVISPSRNPDTVGNRVLRIVGSVSDPNGVSSFNINGAPVPLNQSIWDKWGIYLQEGDNQFIIEAADSNTPPNMIAETLTVHFDTSYTSGANHAPDFLVLEANLKDSLKAGGTYTKMLSAMDIDEFDSIRFTVDSPMIIIDSTISWVTQPEDTGCHVFYVRVYDQDNAYDSVACSIKVLSPSVNSIPSFITKIAELIDSVKVGDLYKKTIQAGDLDNNDILRFSVLQGIGDFSIDSVTGVITFTPVVQDIGLQFVAIQVKDSAGDSASLSWTVTVWDPDKPAADAGNDTVVSIKDVINLHGSGSALTGNIIKYEWDIGNKGFFVITSTGDTSFTAPDSAQDSIICRFRVTDGEGDSDEDMVIIKVVQDIPAANAGSTQVVKINEPFTLYGTGKDSYGTIVKWEWDAGKTGTFVETNPGDAGKFTTVAPASSGPFECVFKVTDDDGNIATASVIVQVIGAIMRHIDIIDSIDSSGTIPDTFSMGSINGEFDECQFTL
ncbi:MAG: hypothetical protein ABIA63_00260, partial [bacterium]